MSELSRSLVDAAAEAVATEMLARYASEYTADHLTWRDFADDARKDIGAALEVLSLNPAFVVPAPYVYHGETGRPVVYVDDLAAVFGARLRALAAFRNAEASA